MASGQLRVPPDKRLGRPENVDEVHRRVDLGIKRPPALGQNITRG